MPTTHRLTLRQEQQAATRQRLLDASRTIFLRDGYTATTVERIAEAANASRATFYLHFRTKLDALLATWGEREFPDVESIFRSLEDEGDFSAETTRAWVERILAYWESHGGIAQTVIQAQALDPSIGETYVANMGFLVDEMPQYVAGAGSAGRARLLLKIIQLERTLYFWTSGALTIDRDELIDALVAEWTLTD